MAGRNADRQEIFFVENCSVAGHNSNELDTASFYVTMTDDEKKYQHFVKKIDLVFHTSFKAKRQFWCRYFAKKEKNPIPLSRLHFLYLKYLKLQRHWTLEANKSLHFPDEICRKLTLWGTLFVRPLFFVESKLSLSNKQDLKKLQFLTSKFQFLTKLHVIKKSLHLKVWNLGKWQKVVTITLWYDRFRGQKESQEWWVSFSFLSRNLL